MTAKPAKVLESSAAARCGHHRADATKLLARRSRAAKTPSGSVPRRRSADLARERWRGPFGHRLRRWYRRSQGAGVMKPRPLEAATSAKVPSAHDPFPKFSFRVRRASNACEPELVPDLFWVVGWNASAHRGFVERLFDRAPRAPFPPQASVYTTRIALMDKRS